VRKPRGIPGRTPEWLRLRAEARKAGGAAWDAWLAAHPSGEPNAEELAAAVAAQFARRAAERAEVLAKRAEARAAKRRATAEAKAAKARGKGLRAREEGEGAKEDKSTHNKNNDNDDKEVIRGEPAFLFYSTIS
jgi:hypothetical protein